MSAGRISNLIIRGICRVGRQHQILQFRPLITPAVQPHGNWTLGNCTITNNVILRKFVHTEGDKELVHFLQEEITYEQENIMEEPKFRDFELNINETKVTLSKDFKGESIEVSFDVNENVNVDEGVIDDEDASLEEAMHHPDIVSYPQFSVKIVKQSGRTLQFNCTCNNIGEEMEGEEPAQNPEEQVDLFRFDTLKVYEQGQPMEGIYEAETDNLDGELYSSLMTILLERGITGTFVNDLLDLSTSIEHKKYLRFLKDLQTFAADK